MIGFRVWGFRVCGLGDLTTLTSYWGIDDWV